MDLNNSGPVDRDLALKTLNDYLARSQKEVQPLKDTKVNFTKASRESILAKDYKRLGVTFAAKSLEMAAVLVGDEPVFQALMEGNGLTNSGKKGDHRS
jgi:hypothetical protein